MQPPAATASHHGKIDILPKAVPGNVPLFSAQKKAKTVTEHHDLARQIGDGLTSVRRGITPLSGSRHIAFTGSGEGYLGCRD
jgi:hypothetical protein